MIEFLHWLAKVGFEVFMQLAQLLLEYLKVLAWPMAVLILALVYKRPLISVLDRLRKATAPGVAFELEAEAAILASDSAKVASQQEQETSEEAPTDHREPTQEPATEPAAESGTADRAQTLREPSNDASERPQQKTSSSTTTVRLPEHAPGRDLRLTAMKRWINSGDSRDRFIQQLFHSGLAHPTVITAWETLERASRAAGQAIGLSSEAYRNVVIVAHILMAQGLISEDTVNIAVRLDNLRHRILDDDEQEVIPTATLLDFVDSAANLTRILNNVTRKLEKSKHADHDNDTLSAEPTP